jgi:hypothetical protein
LPALQIEAVLVKTTPRKRREALNEMPKKLDDAFSITIERIRKQGERSKQAMRLIQWVFLAERSLSLEELLHAFAVEPKDSNLDWENFENGKSTSW